MNFAAGASGAMIGDRITGLKDEQKALDEREAAAWWLR